MPAKKPLLILGGWGSGQIVSSVVEDINRDNMIWEIAGYLNDFEEIGSGIGQYPVIGRTAEAPDYVKKGYFLHYAMRNPKYARSRIQRFKEMNIETEVFATLIHPKAHTSGSKGIGYGSLLCAYTNLSFGAKIGNHNHLYGSSFIGHDSVVEDYAWVANNSSVGARCVIGEGAHLGTNCSLREDVKIGPYAIVGIGAVVLEDVISGGIAVGNPARIIGSVDQYKDDKSAPSSSS